MSRRRSRGLVCIACVGAMLFPFVRPTRAADELHALATTGKAALEDAQYDLAQRQFERYLDLADPDVAPVETRTIALLLLEALYEQGDYQGIVKRLRPRHKRFRKIVDRGAFTFWHALALYETGRFDESLLLLDAMEEDEPEAEYAARAERLRAWCYLEGKRVDDALAAFARFEDSFGASPEGPANLLDWGRTLVAAGRRPRAHDVFTKLTGLSPDLPPVREGMLWRGRLLLEDERWADAVEVLSSLATNENATTDRRAESFISAAAAYRAMDRVADATNALTLGIEMAATPDLVRRGVYDLGLLLLDLGDTEQALARLRGIISASPGDPRAEGAQLRLAESLLDDGVHETAFDEFQHYIETFTNKPGLARAHRGKGWSLSGLDRHAEAASAFSKAAALFEAPSRKQECLFKVADSYFLNGQFDLAAKQYARIAEAYPEGELAPRALLRQGESLAQTGDAAGAEALFLGLAEEFPDSTVGERALLQVAELKAGMGRWLEAIEGFDRIMNVTSNGLPVAHALHGRGMARYNLYRFTAALDDFARVVGEHPRSAVAEQAHYMRGMCHYWLKKGEKAALVWEEFLGRYPDSEWVPEVLYWTGKLEYNRQAFKDAEESFLELVDEYPQSRLADDALLRAGMAAAKRKEYVRSVELLTRLVKEYPDTARIAQVRFAQGEALTELGKHPEAILAFNEIITRHGDSGFVDQAWGRKGNCQFVLGATNAGRYEEAAESYRVVTRSPTASADLKLQAEYRIGRCLEKLGLTSEAFEQYYLKVVLKYLQDRAEGDWHSEASKVWFTRAAFHAADLMGAQNKRKKEIEILERIIEAGVPAKDEARTRIESIRTRAE
ncbi:MAG: tetratricopeptide repeat protein [Lentisphaerae bacterium]|nr:tetratricopeptide repeat protein [Lentisphaerota bacterium]